jgi:hypothetical protein
MNSSKETASVVISVPIGDLIDRITILEIKQDLIKSSIQLDNITKELNALSAELKNSGLEVPGSLFVSLRETNRKIFLLMEDLFPLTTADANYANLSKETVDLNIVRAQIKREINSISGSSLIEEKSYFVSE